MENAMKGLLETGLVNVMLAGEALNVTQVSSALTLWWSLGLTSRYAEHLFCTTNAKGVFIKIGPWVCKVVIQVPLLNEGTKTGRYEEQQILYLLTFF